MLNKQPVIVGEHQWKKAIYLGDLVDNNGPIVAVMEEWQVRIGTPRNKKCHTEGWGGIQQPDDFGFDALGMGGTSN